MRKRKDVVIDQVYLKNLSMGPRKLFPDGPKEFSDKELASFIVPILEMYAIQGKRFAALKVINDFDYSPGQLGRDEDKLTGPAAEIRAFCQRHHLKTRLIKFPPTIATDMSLLIAEW